MTKLLLIPNNKNYSLDNVDGIIIGLKDYSIGYDFCLDITEIEMFIKKNVDKDIFISINKNLSNNDLDIIKNYLIRLNDTNIKGVLFYDLSILYLKQKLNLSLDLVWNQTHMVTNYNTCNYYLKEGCKYAYLSNEITLEEMLEIIEKSDIQTLVYIFGNCTIAHSKRKLLSNYFEHINKKRSKDNFVIKENINNNEYIVKESNLGTTIFNGKILNGIRPLFELRNKVDYVVVSDDGSNNFNYFINIVRDIIDNKENDIDKTILKVEKLYPNTTEGFFYKKTIYKVKKDD